uniref:Uncharacterized protein n=1 Tax=Pristionchus pacificus TaxID=54126 RepID=A0A2A6C0Q3_PRIPA|eukprot:PDM71745.1 hypothetical protein PRIPAC_38152 [Pristionchus pacificus]
MIYDDSDSSPHFRPTPALLDTTKHCEKERQHWLARPPPANALEEPRACPKYCIMEAENLIFRQDVQELHA